jgi:hypothetical protein
MFVFWYCHKRGREVRLAKEAEGEEGEEGVLEVEVSDEDEIGEDDEGEDEDEDDDKDIVADEKADVLNQVDPTDVPLPEQQAKEAEPEAEKRAT